MSNLHQNAEKKEAGRRCYFNFSLIYRLHDTIKNNYTFKNCMRSVTSRNSKFSFWSITYCLN